uniref:EGF-like domain-containing protein n=1 Tax=Caenorhabditis japonica TaxID=281687 RepID=A0A8R1DPZ8_CAEJA
MTNTFGFLVILGIFVTFGCAQSVVEDSVFHFTNPLQGNAVWILDESSLPWTGEYKFLRSISGMATTLLSVVDSSTGITLGQCVAPTDSTGNFSKHWERFSWELTASELRCTFEKDGISRVEFEKSPNPRTFSIRIQSGTGPACISDMMVQREQATGCPPHLSRNSFSAMSLNCTCPYLDAAEANKDDENESEDVDMLATANAPQFPLFKGIDASDLGNLNLNPNSNSNPNPTQWSLAPSPCATHECRNNGTCLVSQEGSATCLCRNGFSGDHCELDVCSTVPCQNGGVCRSNNGIAYCECLPQFTGLLCESAHAPASEPVCQPECSNGQCVAKDGQAQCECRQGFTGANCNVLDVCLGDAACSMFGPTAKCVLDNNMDKMISMALMNGTYDCLCPHPIHGQYVDCIQLHAPTATSLQPVQPMQPVETSSTPPFPVLTISQIPTDAPTIPTVTSTWATPTEPVPSTPQVSSQPSSEPFVGFTVTREPLRQPQPGAGSTLPPPFNQHIITAGEQQWINQQNIATSGVVGQTTTTFVFPQSFETTSSQPVMITTTQPHQLEVSTLPTGSSQEHMVKTTDETDETFPTPSTMQVVPNETSKPLETTTELLPSTTFLTSTVPTETTEQKEESEEEMSTEEITENSTQGFTTLFTVPSSTSTVTPTTTVEEEETSLEEEKEDEEDDETISKTTAQTSLPFWMTTTVKTIIPEVSSTMMVMVPQPEPQPQPEQQPQPQPQPNPFETSTERTVDEESEEDATTESNEEVAVKNAPVATTPSDVVHHHTSSGKQSSAAASWIIAIIALIVLGLLLLATSLFILRYIRQSRKLHGKYNPAREEHNLSAAYAMPMSHIAKEERLI